VQQHLKTQLPLAASIALLLFYILFHASPTASPIEAAPIWGAVALIVLALVQGERLVWRGWRQLDRAWRESARTDPLEAFPRTLSQLVAAVEHWRGQLRDTRATLAREIEARRTAEQALREADERYALAVRGASDGLWEWNLKSGNVYFSPLWKSLLGHEDNEVGNRIEEWHDRIHPDDRSRVLQEMADHLAGLSARFENQHRLLHKDQSWHWVHARGTAIRHAGGTPYRVVGLHTDITARRAAEQMLLEVADSLASARGEACFQIVARAFARVMGVREAFVCEPCDQPPTKARMLAWWCDGGFLPNVEYDLEGTPCKNPQVLGRTCYCPVGLDEQWPLEKPFNRTAYLGIPIHDAAGAVIGHIACTDNKPMPERTPHLTIFRLFAERAGVELERRALLRLRSQNNRGADQVSGFAEPREH
jgi:PAS domain S-box-containing protein